MHYTELCPITHRERTLKLLEDRISVLVTEGSISDGTFRQVTVRPYTDGYDILDYAAEPGKVVVCSRRTPKGALNAAERYVKGEKV